MGATAEEVAGEGRPLGSFIFPSSNPNPGTAVDRNIMISFALLKKKKNSSSCRVESWEKHMCGRERGCSSPACSSDALLDLTELCPQRELGGYQRYRGGLGGTW